mgnify:FL=1
MATLTEVSFYARRVVKWGAIGLVIIMLIPPTLTLIKRIYVAINPPPPPAPTVRYGKLPMLVFPSTTNNFSKLNYRLETIEGGLPKLANVSKIYFVSINKSRILELERIKAKAAVLGFSQAPEKTDEQTYKFVHLDQPAQLTVNIIYNSYIYGYDWRSDADIWGARDVPNNGQALVEAKNFWQSLGLLSGDLADGKAKFTYLAINGGELVSTTALSEANFVRVDLQRSDKDGLPVVTPTNISPVYVIFSGAGDRSKRVIEARYAYSKILDDNFSTYPLKSVDQAWNELQAGGGYVANPAGNQIVVRKASLAYYESDTPQEFFQPVFVFEGDGGFVGYVPAVSTDYSQ